MRYVLIRNKLTVGLLTFLLTAGYLALRWATDYAGLAGAPFALLRYSLPSLAYTMLLAVPVYLLTQGIVRRTSRRSKAYVPGTLRWEEASS